ncbi:YbjQ family protein [Desulfosediminicola sp.]|uniref:YbjQ family protein n=1 Tax=Desulfosediminicola sp. TaxID=2886825 RepID=UPI003AF2C61F
MEILLQHADLVLFFILLCLGYGVGSWAERRHYTSITKREKEFAHLPVVTGKESYIIGEAEKSTLVTGSVVVSIDYFKRLLAILRNIFGGNVKSYESLIDRARREAILRMKEKAKEKGADIIINLRLETSAIGQSANKKRQVGSVEAVAYGTAVSLIKQ